MSVETVRSLIRRVVPTIADQFVLELIPADAQGRDVFEVESVRGRLHVRGNNAVSLASGFHHYLKTVCRCHLSWCGDQLNVPRPLPEVPAKVRVVCPHKRRVYFNYCTLNYTASWWDWPRWEREIDFMALNGINMPLAPVGLEAVWYHALLKIGCNDAEAREFLVGPCFSAWQWMTNIEAHGGPPPKAWIDSRIELGRRILERQRALGMTPIQQGSSGFVPRGFEERFPDAAIVREHPWVDFEGTSQLDPVDPLFERFGKILMETEIELFGTSHYYAADPFHEGLPPQPGDAYLERVGERIWRLMHSVDPEAHWVMQAWSIRKPIATQAPHDRLLVLDLVGEKHDFWGYDFVKGQLHNFGGRINLHGDLRNIAANPFAKAAERNRRCVGMGLFMEGIEQNPVFYNMVFDMIWRDAPVDPVDWVNDYAERRYGMRSEAAEKAWRILLAGPYKRGTSGVENSSIIAARPALRPLKSGPNNGFRIPYRPRELVRAWTLLLSDHERRGASEGYRFDVMDVGRQVLSNLGQEMIKQVALAYDARDLPRFRTETHRFHKLLLDVDALLATRNEYSFDRWVREARAWATNEDQARYYEWNASMLLTIWGPHDNPLIFDYAWREWAGLIRLYYLPRWKMFHDHLASVLEDGAAYADPDRPDDLTHGRHALRANDFYARLSDWEIAWTRVQHSVHDGPVGNTVEVARALHAHYLPLLRETYKRHPKQAEQHPTSEPDVLDGTMWDAKEGD